MALREQAARRARRLARAAHSARRRDRRLRSALPASVLAQEALEEIVVTARFREENLQQTPLAITAITGDMLEVARRDEHARSRRVRAERGHRAARRRLGLDGRRVHSRHRPRRQLAVVRARRADLHRRRLSRPPARRRHGPARPRARRSAARPARHAVRQEHARRRRAHHLAQARRRRHGLHRSRRRLARPLEPARLVRLPARRRQGVRARLGVVEDAGRLLRHPRLRMRQRRGLARPRRPRHHRGRFQRLPPPARDADLRRRRVVAARRHYPPRDRRRSARQRASAPPTRAAASSTTSAARTCSRAASRCASSRPIPSRSTSSPTSRAATSKGPPTSTPCNCARRNGVPPGSRHAASTAGTTASRSRCSAPAGSSTADSKRNDEYTGYHRFGLDPLTAAHHAERQRAQAHRGLQSRPRLGHHRRPELQVHDVVSRFR